MDLDDRKDAVLYCSTQVLNMLSYFTRKVGIKCRLHSFQNIVVARLD